MRSALSLYLLATAMLLSARAGASENYPKVMKGALELDAEPPCTLCHASEAGGAKTVVTPFGRTMILFGASGGQNGNSLREALQACDEAVSDSDRDGIGDIDELRMNGDPNWNPGGNLRELPIARHGCAVTPGARGQFGLCSPLLILLFVLSRRARRFLESKRFSDSRRASGLGT